MSTKKIKEFKLSSWAISNRMTVSVITFIIVLSGLLSYTGMARENFPEIIISVDTFRSKVAKETINAGAALINDISGGKMDDNMFATVSKLQVPYILMHMKGTPQNMQKNPTYGNITTELFLFLRNRFLNYINYISKTW